MSDSQNLEIGGLSYLGYCLYRLAGIDSGATVRVYPHSQGGGKWSIMSLKVTAEHRGCGLGSHMLKAVCAAADERGIVLDLAVEPLGEGLGEEQLGAWYERYGFVYEDNRYIMVRMPGACHE